MGEDFIGTLLAEWSSLFGDRDLGYTGHNAILGIFDGCGRHGNDAVETRLWLLVDSLGNGGKMTRWQVDLKSITVRRC